MSSFISIADVCNNSWNQICKNVKKGVVFLDASSAECLHWNGGLQRLMKAGAVALKEFNPFESALPIQKKAIFMLTRPLIGVTLSTLRSILANSSFEYCEILTTVDSSVQALSFRSTENNDEKLETEILGWMGNYNYTCNIQRISFGLICVCETQSSSIWLTSDALIETLQPPLGCDLLKGLLGGEKNNTKFLPSSTNNNSANYDTSLLDKTTLPEELQVSVLQFVNLINAMLEIMNISEDIFTLGRLSHFVGSELEALQVGRLRRKKFSSNNASLIIIDRHLDLAMPTWIEPYFGSALDRILTTLPHFENHLNDVFVDMSSVIMGESFDENNDNHIFAPGCLVTTDRCSDEENLLNILISVSANEAVDHLKRRIYERISFIDEDINNKSKLSASSDLKDLVKSMASFFNDENVLNLKQSDLNLLQTTQSVCLSNCPHDVASNHYDKIAAIQLDLRQKMIEGQQEHMLGFIAKLILTRKSEKITLDDVLLILVHVYSLVNPDLEFNAEEFDLVSLSLSEAILGDALSSPENLGHIIKKMIQESTINELMVHKIVSEIFTRLNSLKRLRNSLSSNMIDQLSPSPSSGKLANNLGLLERLFDSIFSENGKLLPDLKHHAGGLGSILKSGFSMFGMPLGVSSHKHPREFPTMIVFILGGISPCEIRQIRQIASNSGSKIKIMLGSNSLISPWDTLKSVFNVDRLSSSS